MTPRSGYGPELKRHRKELAAARSHASVWIGWLYRMSSEHVHHRRRNSSSILLDKHIRIFVLFDHSVFYSLFVPRTTEVCPRVSDLPRAVKCVMLDSTQPPDGSRFAQQFRNARTLKIVSTRGVKLSRQSPLYESYAKNDNRQVLTVDETISRFLEQKFGHEPTGKLPILSRWELRRKPPQTFDSFRMTRLVLVRKPLLRNVRVRCGHTMRYNARRQLRREAPSAWTPLLDRPYSFLMSIWYPRAAIVFARVTPASFAMSSLNGM